MTLDPSQLELVYLTHLRDERGETSFSLFFRAYGWTGELTNAEPDVCAELRWYAWTDLPESVIRYVRGALDAIRAGRPYSQSGFSGPGDD